MHEALLGDQQKKSRNLKNRVIDPILRSFLFEIHEP